MDRPRLFRQIVRAVGVAALLLLLTTILVGPLEPLKKGTPAPPTHGRTLDGGDLDLRQLRGQFVFVNVWATWCAPCLQELPSLAAAATLWQKEVVFVGLAAESPAKDVERIGAAIPYPVLRIDGATQQAWHAEALPSSFVLDKAGNIVWSTSGALDEATLSDVLTHITQDAGQSKTTMP